MSMNFGNKLRKVTTTKSKMYTTKTLGSTSLQHESRCNVKLEKIDHVMGNKVMDESNERTCNDEEKYTNKYFKSRYYY